MSTARVVRVEEVDRLNIDISLLGKSKEFSIEDFPNIQTRAQQKSDVEIAGSTDGNINDELDDLEEIQEAEDKVFPLPENWPKIPQLLRRKSCELTSNSSPCVNKAVSHLELIQNIIEEWFKEKDEERRSATESVSVRPDVSRKQLRFASPSNKSAEDKRTQSVASQRTRMSSAGTTQTTLSIKGVGAYKEEEVDGLDIPYLGAEDVIDEVITLLARLENDRRETEKALATEKTRVIRLNEKIDNLCLRRMKELPAIVQKEHEACIMDLNEMQWHVSYSSRNMMRIENKLDVAKVLNKRLKDDIVFVKKHIPLVEEKLVLERLAMEKIKSAQTDTTTELDNTKQRQEKTKAISSEAEKKAETERGHIKRELDTVRDALSAVSEELSQAKMTYNAYVHQSNDIRQQLKDNAQELQVLEVKNENSKVAEEMQAKKVRALQTKITESEFEHNRLESENAQLQQELDTKKSANAHKIKELENSVKYKDSKLRDMLLKNQEAEMEVQDLYDKIAECTRQKVSDEKNISRIHKEMNKLSQQMAVTMEEYNKIQSINQTIRDQLHSEEEKAFKMEESLKATADTLRRQVKDEVHTRTVLVARISSDSTDLTKYKSEARNKNDKHYKRKKVEKPKAQKVADDVTSVVNEVETKVEKLRSAKQEKIQKKAELTEQLEETKKQEAESRQRFDEKLGKIAPHHRHLKDDVLKLDKRLDHMEWKTDVMNKQMDDMNREQGTMDRLTANTEKAIQELEETVEEVNLQLEAVQRIDDGLKITYNQILGRIKENEANHRNFKEERSRFLAECEVQRNRKLEINKELASKYRQLQNEFLSLKDKLLNNFDARVKLESAIKDCRQLQSLQKRMHAAMLEYFKYRGLYSKSELGRMEHESDGNSDKVLGLQTEMNSALSKISDFLETQMDGSAARKIAYDAIRKHQRESITGSSPEHLIPPVRQASMIQA